MKDATDEPRMEQARDVDPGTWVFEVRPGPVGADLILADGRRVHIGSEGGQERIHIQEPQEVVIAYQANGRPPAGVNLSRVG